MRYRDEISPYDKHIIWQAYYQIDKDKADPDYK